MPPRFFETPAKFRAWLEKHHRTADELLVGFYKKGSGRPSMTVPESVEEALCFGWIDGVCRTIDAESYSIRFTPRRKGSVWSALNTRRATELLRAGRMRAAGRAAFEARNPETTASQTVARATARLDTALERRFKSNRRAWTFFQTQPPGYRKMAAWWVMSAKREETRLRRLAALVEVSAEGRRLVPMQPLTIND